MRARTILHSLLLLLTNGLVAQNTWIVDARNGSGTHFTAIAPAVQAAAPGDTIIVRAGTYVGFNTNKPLTMLGEPGAVISRAGQPGVVIFGLPASTTFVLRGFRLTCPNGFCGHTSAVITDNRGAVHVADVTFSNGSQAALSVGRCDHVTLTNCRGNAHGCLAVQYSVVSVVDCQFRSEMGVYLLGSPAAIEAVSAQVHIAGGTYRGGDGQGTGPLRVVAAPGIRASSSGVLIAGDTTVIEAGDWNGGTTSAVTATNGGLVVLDPATTLIPKGAAPFTGNVLLLATAALTGSAAPGVVSLRLHAEPGVAYGLVAALPVRPGITPLGMLWFDPSAAIAFASGVVHPSGIESLTLPVAAPQLGLPIVFQGLTSGPRGVRLTTATTVVVP